MRHADKKQVYVDRNRRPRPSAPPATSDGPAAALESIPRIWSGRLVVVAATGPSLTPEVAEACRDYPTIAVSDAWRLMPWADMLYSCDAGWWIVHDGARGYLGERWSTHGGMHSDDKADVQARYGVRLVKGRQGETFSTDPAVVHYGDHGGQNSGLQALGIALLTGAARVVLIGFDMRDVEGKRHFFGDHPRGLSNSKDFGDFRFGYRAAAKSVPAGVEIINATPESALDCFPRLDLAAALALSRAT